VWYPAMTVGPALFSELNCLSPDVVKTLNAQSFVRATPVQEAVLPLFCSHKDVAVDAATGSGKTLAFILPIVERLRSVRPGPLDVSFSLESIRMKFVVM
jgi:superfamily II DNA/RNA helicase